MHSGSMRGLGCIGVLVGVVGVAYTARADIASFQGLGALYSGSPYSSAAAVSADGSVVVGLSRSAPFTNKAFRWENGIMSPLDDLSGGGIDSAALGVSADGSVIVGRSETDLGDEACVWAQGPAGMPIRTTAGVRDTFRAGTVSYDGSTVYGSHFSGQAFQYSGGVVSMLGDLPAGLFVMETHGVSADGSLVVGAGIIDEAQSEAYLWLNGVGESLGDLPGGLIGSKASAVSADASTIVGHVRHDAGTEAVRWDRVTLRGEATWTPTVLGEFGGGSYRGSALGASQDGSVIVGYSSTENGREAFLWDAVHGMRNLKTVLETEHGLDLTGWTLDQATSITPDGKTLVGVGSHQSFGTEAWIATIPEPGSLVLMLAAGVAVALRRR